MQKMMPTSPISWRKLTCLRSLCCVEVESLPNVWVFLIYPQGLDSFSGGNRNITCMKNKGDDVGG